MKTIKKFTGTILIVALAVLQLSAGNFKVNTNDSNVKWLGKKVTGEHYGLISLKAGSLEVADGKIVSGNLQVDMNSMTCEDIKDEGMAGKLMGHLKSDDFFSVEKNPVSTLKLVSAVGDDNGQYTFKGDLTIKGVTHPVTFTGEVKVDGSVLKAKGKVIVDRTLYDIKYGSGKFFSDLGDKMIHDTFSLDFNVVASE